MTDRVETLLRRAMEEEATNAPASGDLAGAARGRVARRRRRMFESAGALAVVVAMVVGVGFFLTRGSGQPHDAVGPADTNRVAAPLGTRLVGFGHAAIAVPEDWGTNKTQCGTPVVNTVVIDVGFWPSCLRAYPAGIQSVELLEGDPRFDFVADETIDIDGVKAQRQRTTCEDHKFDVGQKPADPVTVCHGSIYLPSLKVGFTANSSTSAAEVDTILSWIRIVPDAVGIPGYQTISIDAQGKGQQRYLEALQEAGLKAEIRTEKQPAMPAGFLLGVSPSPGTLVEPGSVVTVTVVAEPEGPADEVRVEMSSENAEGGDFRDLSDPDIRAGATIRLGVGDHIWAYALGERTDTLAGKLDGTSLELDDWKDDPNRGHSWVATSPGTTKITLSITADGVPVVLGTVTVVVR